MLNYFIIQTFLSVNTEYVIDLNIILRLCILSYYWKKKIYQIRLSQIEKTESQFILQGILVVMNTV